MNPDEGVFYLTPEEEAHRDEFLRAFPDPEKYARYLRLVQRHNFEETRNGLFETDEWKKSGSWNTFIMMEHYALSRCVLARRIVNGKRLLGAGPNFH